MKVKLENVRLAFPQLWVATTVGEDDKNPAYSASFLIPKKSPLVKLVNEAMDACAKEKWESKSSDILKQLRAADRVCLHDGDLKSDYAGFPGSFFIAARNKARPLVIDRNKSPLTQADGKPYAGCYVNATIDVWAQDNGYGKRVNATLSGVQFAKDGDAFSGAPPATPEDFEDLADGADADDLV